MRSVGRPVVRQHAFDGDAQVGEPGHGPAQHRGGGGGGFVGVDFGVGDAGVVVDNGVDERGAGAGLVVGAAGQPRGGSLVDLALSPADVAPAAAVGDVAELGDIDMDQRSGMVVFVAAQRFAGDPVDVGEPVDPATHQYRVQRGCRQAEPAGDLDRAQPVTPPQPHDRPHHRPRSAGRAAVGTAAAISHPGYTFDAVTIGPLRGRLRRDHEHFRCGGVGPALLDDQAGESESGAWGQGGVRVGHEGLRWVKRFLDSSTSQPEAFTCLCDRPPVVTSTRDNVPGHHT
ncbi:hypothetical protein H4696_001325 [Amycolatopsis lexingtonensis]|uniref:Uncharacterized protein n=1 Tax=Amycolatopsis lexingtonensis TaxID=218822 RepID=A0ABR9HTH4_9PSEU|nr:hypothetical protein [Amycolatopsis lexingtonensis]